jgi:hypothetical protein
MLITTVFISDDPWRERVPRKPHRMFDSIGERLGKKRVLGPSKVASSDTCALSAHFPSSGSQRLHSILKKKT